jgi:C4-dicarboxylate-specific signal transduction histidine kinase
MTGMSAAIVEPSGLQEPARSPGTEVEPIDDLRQANSRLREQIETMHQLLRKGEERRRAMLHIMVDMNDANRRLADQRKAMLHILGDYESDRRALARQTESLRNTRRALLHILQDAHGSNQRLERSRKAMIHIMGDLQDTTHEMQWREQELREKQEQLVQAAKLATLGELTTGVAHELNNPLNNIGLFIGNVIDALELGRADESSMLRQLQNAMQQVRKATEIITHLRTFGRAAPFSHEPTCVNGVIDQSLTLMREQLKLRSIEVVLDLDPRNPMVMANPIRLEQVFMNLLTNARDALAESSKKVIRISSRIESGSVVLTFEDSGPGVPPALEHRIFDPFFTTKDVGAGTGLGLSITYGIVKDHEGSIKLDNRPGEGATFVIELPLARQEYETEATT